MKKLSPRQIELLQALADGGHIQHAMVADFGYQLIRHDNSWPIKVHVNTYWAIRHLLKPIKAISDWWAIDGTWTISDEGRAALASAGEAEKG